MFSIRTTLVVAAFVAAGLFSVAEYLADSFEAADHPFATVSREQSLSGDAVEMTRRALGIMARAKGAPAI